MFDNSLDMTQRASPRSWKRRRWREKTIAGCFSNGNIATKYRLLGALSLYEADSRRSVNRDVSSRA